jgi:outer membrane protein assembly factor BamE
MRRLFPLLLICATAACSTPRWDATLLTPYRIDVRQGNYVSQDMVAQLKPGLTRDQVRFILGTPLVADVFHADRWDYIYRFQPGHGEVERRHLAVFFSDGKLARLGGDVIAENAASPEAAAKSTSRIIDIPGDPVAPKTPAAAKSVSP